MLHPVAHLILTRQQYSYAFSSILVKCVISKMPEMGNPGARSELYLLLFKQLFGTVVHLKNGENEEMILPHIEAIVNGALTNSKRARDPMTYFMLLRSLFRSISGRVSQTEKKVLFDENCRIFCAESLIIVRKHFCWIP